MIIAAALFLVSFILKLVSHFYNKRWQKTNPELMALAKQHYSPNAVASYSSYHRHQNLCLLVMYIALIVLIVSLAYKSFTQ